MKRSHILAALAIALVILVAIILKLNSANSSASAPVLIKLPWFVSPEHAFLYLGIEEGLFKPIGGITIEPTQGSHEVAKAFELEHLHFGFISADSLVMARQNGVPLKALFVVYPESPAVLVSLKEKDITDAHKLIGKNVGVMPTSTTYPQFLWFMDAELKGMPDEQRYHNTGPLKNVEEIPAIRGGIAQLLQGDFDVLTHYINFAPVQLRLKGHEVNVIHLKKHIKTISTVFAASDDIITSDPARVQALVNALLESLHRTLNSPENAAAALLKSQGSAIGDAQYVHAGLKASLDLITSKGRDRLGEMSKQDWNATEQTLIDVGQAKDIDDAYYYDCRFVNKYYEGK